MVRLSDVDKILNHFQEITVESEFSLSIRRRGIVEIKKADLIAALVLK